MKSRRDSELFRELEADIARTRARLEAKLAALDTGPEATEATEATAKVRTQGARERTQEVVMARVNEMGHKVTERSKEAGGSLIDLVREHPLPTALIGAGIALLAAGGGVGVREHQRSENDESDYEGYGGRYGYGEGDYTGYVRSSRGSGEASQFESYGAYDSGYDTGEGDAYTGHETYATSWSEDSDEGLQERAREVGKRVQHTAERTERGIAGFVEDQPLVAGLITLVLGALLGLLFPSTKRENELLGGARDQLGEQAREVAARARNVAQRTFEEARDSAKEEFSKLSSEAKEDGRDLFEKGKEAAKHVGERAREAAKEETDKSA